MSIALEERRKAVRAQRTYGTNWSLLFSKKLIEYNAKQQQHSTKKNQSTETKAL